MEKLKKKIFSDFLVSKMSFLVGMGSVFNLGGSYFEYNRSKDSIEADEKAILRDWQVIGQDFLDVLEDEGIEEKVTRERKMLLDA